MALALLFAAVVQGCAAPRVVDGDTLRCGNERLRLLGIDAPELHGCPRYRQCAPGDPVASTLSLSEALRSGPFRYRVVTVDRYGRSVVVAWAGGINLSCWQLERGQAIYKPQWDNGRLIGHECH
jgi:micrococcal nuclease